MKYSWDLNDWVIEQIPKPINEAMSKVGWNALGVYEVVKEGIALEKKGKLTHVSTPTDVPPAG